MSTLPAAIIFTVLVPLLGLSAQQDPSAPTRSNRPKTRDSATEIPVETPKQDTEEKRDLDRDEVTDLLGELEATLESITRARLQAENVKKIVETLDSGKVEATDKEMVKTNKFVRQKLASEYRALRARAKSVSTQVSTVLQPKQRGIATKLKTRWDLEEDPSTKSKIKVLLADHDQAMAETAEQLSLLDSRIRQLDGALGILEDQLSYLDLVEETIGLSRQVANQLKDLNQEIDKVLQSFVEKEIQK
ncbi:MAG: hypothetical protein IPN34_07655 [Planctomycetes bacterium]|nr:hypothetical protein [Planctomycetota bacterium]